MQIIELEKINSTNDYIKKIAQNSDEGLIVTAREQTGGKGRLGRTFLSPRGGLYMSILLKPTDLNTLDFITPIAAVAVAQAVEEYTDKFVGIKWVNDVMLDGKKLCGILCESEFCADMPLYAIVGIGVNVFAPNGFSDEIANTATALFYTAENEKIYNELTQKISENFFRIYNSYQRSDFVEIYRKKSVLVGKKVTIRQGNAVFCGEVLGFNEKCNIILKTDNGECILSSGTLH